MCYITYGDTEISESTDKHNRPVRGHDALYKSDANLSAL
jgi:hypothetical protein